jgi:hypothetical protein
VGLAEWTAFLPTAWDADNQTITARGVQSFGDFAIALTLGAGTVAIEELGDVPVSYRLGPNYPNPFNPTTMLEYAVPASGHVTIAVYDLTGREVTRLIDETIGAGQYRVTWEARDAPSGIYLVRMQAGTFSSSRMVPQI